MGGQDCDETWSSQALIRSLLTRSAARIGRHRLGPTRQRKGTRRADRKKGQTPDDDMSRMLAVVARPNPVSTRSDAMPMTHINESCCSVLGRFNRPMQHRTTGVSVAVRRILRPGSASRGSCEACR
uniref:Uncharacterized protein n=1 Tax=Rhodococcus sp. NS1 TaxID=402236 RepID=A0A097SQQ4_9NOCA|nr:hypothetical protein LRS1606.439 [Rhodococcus sp. NS1]